MSRTKLLVTGATGLLGSHLLSLFESSDSQWEIVAWNRARHGNLLQQGAAALALKRERPDFVMHLAWNPTGTSSYDVDENNRLWVEASLDLARSCVDQGVQFFGTGTCLEYSDSAAATPYLTSKRELFSRLVKLLGIDNFAWIRPFWIVSIADRRPRLVADALAAQDDGHEFVARHPEHQRDFIEISDVATALKMLLVNASMGVCDVGSGTSRTVEELLNRVLSASSTINEDLSPNAVGSGDVADVRQLVAYGWAPEATSRLFGHDR